MNGFSHHYQLDVSTFIFRGVRSDFYFLSHFSMKFLCANRIATDVTPHSAASHLGLCCLAMSHKKDTRLIRDKKEAILCSIINISRWGPNADRMEAIKRHFESTGTEKFQFPQVSLCVFFLSAKWMTDVRRGLSKGGGEGSIKVVHEHQTPNSEVLGLNPFGFCLCPLARHINYPKYLKHLHVLHIDMTEKLLLEPQNKQSVGGSKTRVYM